MFSLSLKKENTPEVTLILHRKIIEITMIDLVTSNACPIGVPVAFEIKTTFMNFSWSSSTHIMLVINKQEKNDRCSMPDFSS